MDYREFDALPLKGDDINVINKPLHDGIRDMPSLSDVGVIVSSRLEETGRTIREIADCSGTTETIVNNMTGGKPVPLEPAMRVFDAIGVKPERVPVEYLET